MKKSVWLIIYIIFIFLIPAIYINLLPYIDEIIQVSTRTKFTHYTWYEFFKFIMDLLFVFVIAILFRFSMDNINMLAIISIVIVILYCSFIMTFPFLYSLLSYPKLLINIAVKSNFKHATYIFGFYWLILFLIKKRKLDYK